MAKKAKQKGTRGAAVAYISRKQALKKLQLTLKDFRRLCILKGIYPVEPSRKRKVNHGSSAIKTYYFLKDIQFLSHEPIINKFRELKVFVRRLKKAVGKNDREGVKRIRENWPEYQLDNIVKERYPTFLDSVRDLDDTLAMCFLMSTFPKSSSVKTELVTLCQRLIIEFMHYVIESRALRKVFISIKGYYYQAEILGQPITWIVPHQLGYQPPNDVDFKVMVTFTEFYTTMLGFVNYKLYHMINLVYPPKLNSETAPVVKADEDDENEVSEWICALNHGLKSVGNTIETDDTQIDEFPDVDDKLKESWKEVERIKKLENLFKGMKFYLNREVPRESLVFVLRAFGAEVSWDQTVYDGATYDEHDESITHQIVDRPSINNQFLNRYYIQPQWVYDSVNNRALLSVQDYFPGVALPPHLSPFVEEKEGEYVPPERVALLNFQKGKGKVIPTNEEIELDFPELSEEDDDSEDSEVEVKQSKSQVKKRKASNIENESKKMAVEMGKIVNENLEMAKQKQEAEEKRLAVMMIPKKKRRLYEKIMYGKRRNVREADKLKTKREEYDKNAKKQKKTANVK